MKLNKFAEKLGITYQTAWKWYKAGRIHGAYQTETGTILVPEDGYVKRKVVTEKLKEAKK